MAIAKPVGLVTAAQHSRNPTALDLTRDLLRLRREKNSRVFVVHEVDRDASGVVVFARTPEVAETLRRQFRSRKTDRLYVAVIEGTLPPDAPPTVTIRSRLAENRRGVAQSVADDEAIPTGPNRPLAAVTHMRSIGEGDGLTLVRLRAETDHNNQLRAHMAESGHPIGGDRAYGSKRREFPRLALHLAEVTFEHPGTNDKLRLRVPTPAAFYTVVGKTPPGDAPAPEVKTAEGESRETHWDRVSAWYDELLTDRGSDHHEKVLIPGSLRLLDVQPGQRVLDVACGQGILSRAIAATGAEVLGVDASASLIERARELRPEGAPIEFRVGDAQRLTDTIDAGAAGFDAATCLMALMNIEDLFATLAGVAALLKPGGRFVAAILHPAFRTPRRTAWGWEGPTPETQQQFRRVDAYLGEEAIEITMNPGAASDGAEAVTTTTFHRPISAYVDAARHAGLVIEALEEWASERESKPGPRADEENRARREIPMFLAFCALKPPAT
ncbi:MAG: methyltransferase domain-containing protein [Phycisphaeraceae bacterium]|nr:MAG: methyltransferase domain-containing protein [Phycisphaeraceae bacterium]